MNTKLFISSIFLSASLSLFAQKSATITLHTDQSEQIIPKEIYGQFAEHLGTCIYGGLWVGENSDIPNINGYRTDVFNALKASVYPSFAGREAALPMNTTGWTVSALKKTAPKW